MVQLSATWQEALHQHCKPPHCHLRRNHRHHFHLRWHHKHNHLPCCHGHYHNCHHFIFSGIFIIIIYLVVIAIITIITIFIPCSVVGWWASEFGLPLSPMDNRPCHALRPLPAPPLKVLLQSSNEDFHVFQCGYILIFSIWRICISLLCFHAPLSALSSSFCCRVIHAPRSTLSFLHHFPDESPIEIIWKSTDLNDLLIFDLIFEQDQLAVPALPCPLGSTSCVSSSLNYPYFESTLFSSNRRYICYYRDVILGSLVLLSWLEYLILIQLLL